MLNTNFDVTDGELTVALEGRLDALTAQSFEKELESAIDGVSSVIIDCEKLEYISSAGLRTILAAEQYMEENGYEDVKLKNANEAIMDILEETGFTDLVEII